jgi:hypothetical protein
VNDLKETGSIEVLEGLFGSREKIEDKTEIENGSKHDNLIEHLDGFSLQSSLKLDWRNDPFSQLMENQDVGDKNDRFTWANIFPQQL